MAATTQQSITYVYPRMVFSASTELLAVQGDSNRKKNSQKYAVGYKWFGSLIGVQSKRPGSIKRAKMSIISDLKLLECFQLIYLHFLLSWDENNVKLTVSGRIHILSKRIASLMLVYCLYASFLSSMYCFRPNIQKYVLKWANAMSLLHFSAPPNSTIIYM